MSIKGSSRRIDKELVSIDALVYRLKEINPKQVIFVREESDDPPDFWVTIGRTEYAAEVTSIVADEDYATLYRKLVDDIRAGAVAEGSMRGTCLSVKDGQRVVRGRCVLGGETFDLHSAQALL